MASAIWFILVLSALVLVHEIGHFVAGRLVGARIEEFAIGFPPRLWSVRRGDTDYSINLIPLGGYVRFSGEENPVVTGGLASLSRLRRAFVLTAGVAMNILLAAVLFTALYADGMTVPASEVKINGIAAGSPAEQVGLLPGDIVVQFNGQAISRTDQLSTMTRAAVGQEVSIVVSRGESQVTVRLTPRPNPPANEGPLGVSMAVYEMRSYPLSEAIVLGVRETVNVVYQTLTIPAQVVQGILPAEVARPVGPLGVGRIVGGAADLIPTRGFAPIVLTMAILSVSLGVVNFLPLPGLDGGRLVFVCVEWLRRGKRIDPQREAVIHFAGIMLILGLVVVITYLDIVSPTPNIWGP